MKMLIAVVMLMLVCRTSLPLIRIKVCLHVFVHDSDPQLRLRGGFLDL